MAKNTEQEECVSPAQVAEMTQMLIEQSRRLRELEIRLQKEKQEKANLAIDFQHLLDQLNFIANGPSALKASIQVATN